ncbi:hypothetical protein ZEAMMB73_Zm00001d009148 [Zea mays]|uniref:Uncharacterized protein n=1 Tax=Zea mays TaxID=4577 RepID=A0A1D6FHY6_MAIZE|nr:hypothetical protein ZEAMMB73_Zm00001d009148 [Zea mays]
MLELCVLFNYFTHKKNLDLFYTFYLYYYLSVYCRRPQRRMVHGSVGYASRQIRTNSASAPPKAPRIRHRLHGLSILGNRNACLWCSF